MWTLLGICCSVLVALSLRINLKEDISDFLPQDNEYKESMEVFTNLSEASRIVFIYEGICRDSLCSAIDQTAEMLPQAITQADIDAYTERLQFVYANMPYFLSDSDYVALDDKLTNTYLQTILEQDKQILTTPGTAFLQPSIACDPLRLIPFDKGATGQFAAASSAFTAYDGYMMTADYQKAFVFYDSPYSSTETLRNASLVDSLNQVCYRLQELYPNLNVRLLGSPVIAVENARCVKRDSIVAILLSLLLITALLLYAFPRKRDIVLIMLTVLFGWVCGMAALSVCFKQVSTIVLGIGSVMIGIAVNYPLHLLVHQRYTASVKQTLQEVISPLVVGNITTVGAFLALIPIRSAALQQLGVFASANLLGTILYCIIFLPQMMHSEPTAVREIHFPLLTQLNNKVSMRTKTIAIFLQLISLAFIPVFKPYDLFDADIAHLNYMTPQQRADFAFFEQLNPASPQTYTLSEAKQTLEKRIEKWNEFWSRHDISIVCQTISNEAAKKGMRPELFAPFYALISQPFQIVDLSQPKALAQRWPGQFNTKAMNMRIADTLNQNFNYLTIACSLIVFVFLCFSFKSFRIGLIAFLPMVFSGIMIGATMQLAGLHFNIVNIILATFIFGQGDDYTIFVVEGLLYEHKNGQKMLKRYIQSILLSAIIMLFAIGVLAFSHHPAMSSLGWVVLVGMFSVVLMAFTIPPMLFYLFRH